MRESKMRLSVRDGVVEIAGHARSGRDAMAAMGTARRVPGVLGVRSHVTDDETLTGAVAQALTADAATRAAHLTVRVHLGSVALDGRVPTQATHDAATALARAVSGVASVSNGAQIAAAPALRPAMPGGDEGETI